jgi:hypothetical protein
MPRLRDLVRREPKHRIHLPAWLERLVSIGIVSRDEQIIRRQRCVNLAAFATMASGFFCSAPVPQVCRKRNA